MFPQERNFKLSSLLASEYILEQDFLKLTFGFVLEYEKYALGNTSLYRGPKDMNSNLNFVVY